MEVFVIGLQIVHVVAGFCSLILFWLPVFTRKGGVNHVKVGKIYVKFMWVVVISAMILCLKNLFIGQHISAAFLGFLALITANPLWHGIAVTRVRPVDYKNYYNKLVLFKGLILLSGSGLIIYGLIILHSGNSILMFIFGGLSFTEVPAIYKLLKSKLPKVENIKEHLIAMCTSGIAAYTAFFVFGANQIFNYEIPGYWAIIPWIAPSILGTIGISYLVHRLKKVGIN